MKKNLKFNIFCFSVSLITIFICCLVVINANISQNNFIEQYNEKMRLLEDRIIVLENKYSKIEISANKSNTMEELGENQIHIEPKLDELIGEAVISSKEEKTLKENTDKNDIIGPLPYDEGNELTIDLHKDEVKETSVEVSEPIEEPEVVKNLTDITQKSNLTEEEFNLIIDSMLDHYNKGNTKLRGKGYLFVKVEETSGVNGLFALSVATLESGYGTSSLCINNNNWLGISKSGGGYRYFESDEECFIYWAYLIRDKYINQGLTSISSISRKYCPPNPDKWTSDVQWAMNKYIGYLK